MSFSISSPIELQPIAKELIALMNEHSVFVFEGEMGAGKTTLVGEICRQLGIRDFSSPTYSIVNTYKSDQLGNIFHFDFYRLKDEKEAVESGLDEMLDSGNICFLEWASKISKLLPPTYVRVGIQLENELRKIEIEIIGEPT
ncbi:MAG: tRNA (adenosine(37)-N6)-threonylcarbamoyltransferase complex ATPase subunit type 1 TsaE [Flavobacteriales bacterium]|nr:tRNA (adenosine(37)-N6)-threonylcarbamoyltransferase complex ATPase subunit type 1 TsaE [Flavobacteriales bacterium]